MCVCVRARARGCMCVCSFCVLVCVGVCAHANVFACTRLHICVCGMGIHAHAWVIYVCVSARVRHACACVCVCACVRVCYRRSRCLMNDNQTTSSRKKSTLRTMELFLRFSPGPGIRGKTWQNSEHTSTEHDTLRPQSCIHKEPSSDFAPGSVCL